MTDSDKDRAYFWCPECGPGVAADEDHLCASCGRDCASIYEPPGDFSIRATLDAARARAESAERESKEQARLNGMGSEREARLEASLKEAEGLLRIAVPSIDFLDPDQYAGWYAKRDAILARGGRGEDQERRKGAL